MARFADMQAADFNRFRVYFSSNKCPFAGNLAGPSGLYSSKIPTLDLLLSGSHLPDHFPAFLAGHADYYPIAEKPERVAAQSAARNGKSVLDAIHQLGGDENLARDFADLQKTLAAFRRAHMQSIVKFIPEVVQSGQSGTGGEGIGLLRARSAMHGEAISKCPFHQLAALVRRFRGERGAHA